jgi:hypothetical protein
MTRLNTKDHNTTRISLGRLLRSYQNDEIEPEQFRNLIYGLNVMLSYFRHASDLEIERRLEVIEDQLEQQRP